VINETNTEILQIHARPIDLRTHIQGGSIKSKPLPNDHKIVLKPVNEIRFIRQIKAWI